MPRSWPNTDAEPTDGLVELGEQGPDRRSRPSIEVEVIGLDPLRPVHITRRDSSGGRRGWPIWIAIGVMAAGGLALLPGETVAPTSTTSDQALPQPETATTSTTPLPAESQAVVTDETFSLIPAAGLDGFTQFAGPIEFDGRYWIAGNSPYPSWQVSILSSPDGARWEVESTLSSGNGSWLRVDDLDSFGGVLMAVGTIGQIDEPAYAPMRSGDLVLWKSPNGVQWSSLSIVDDGGVEFSGVQLTTSSEEVLITGQRRNAFDPSVLAQIPPEFGPGLERGDFTFWNDYSSIRIVAPPGIELFRMSVTEPVPSASTTAILLRSDNLIIWEELPVTFSSWSVAATLDGGFVSNALGFAMYSSDGRSWDPTDRFPPLFYQSWGDRLVGLDYSVIHPNLIVVDGDGTATIDLPPEIGTNESGMSITPGASGLATILGTFENTTAGPITRIDGYVLAMDPGRLRIEEPSGETSYAHFGGDGLIEGTYLPETDSIRFQSSDGTKAFEFPIAVFLDLRPRVVSGLFDVFLSRDGLEWARPQTGLRAAYADILGGAGETFLVTLHNYDRDYQELPITVYRTGPIG